MCETRRQFVMALAATGSYLAMSESLGLSQKIRGMPSPPLPADPQETDKNSRPGEPQIERRRAVLQNEKDFRAGVERLYQLTSELREEVHKTATSNVLSVGLYKKTEEIEKLARQLKNKAKG